MGNKVFALKIHGPREYSFSESGQVHSSLDAGVGAWPTENNVSTLSQ